MAREVITLGPPKPRMCNWLMVVLILTAVNSVCLLTIIVIVSLKPNISIPFYQAGELQKETVPKSELPKVYPEILLPKQKLPDQSIQASDLMNDPEIAKIGDDLAQKFEDTMAMLIKNRLQEYPIDKYYYGNDDEETFPSPGNTFNEDLRKALGTMKVNTRPKVEEVRQAVTGSSMVGQRIFELSTTTTTAPQICPEAQSKLCLNWREKQFCAIAVKFCESLCVCDK
ncbi:unnamed protein product, partial [Mesorhabditis belari]|uniref:Uncharacterized protein n=1 Tax=Mesorhabditis belari TaxID=2138241 RepID=A0AAF3J7R3_9BILA